MPGRLITNSVTLAPHEKATIDCLIKHGKNIELLIPNYTKGNKNPDFVMDGLLWEAKSPITSSFDNLAVTLRRAAKQSPNLVVDVRRMRKPENVVVKFLTNYFYRSRSLKHLIIVGQAQPIIKLQK